MRTNGKDYHFRLNCVRARGRDVQELSRMIDRAREITWETLIRHVPVDEIHELFPHYHGSGLHIKDDWAVGFYKSKWYGRTCYYIDWSAIEFVFTKGEK